MAHQVWHIERRRWRKAQRAGVQKEEDFLPLEVQETCLEIWMKMVLGDLMQKVK